MLHFTFTFELVVHFKRGDRHRLRGSGPRFETSSGGIATADPSFATKAASDYRTALPLTADKQT